MEETLSTLRVSFLLGKMNCVLDIVGLRQEVCQRTLDPGNHLVVARQNGYLALQRWLPGTRPNPPLLRGAHKAVDAG